jgi:hypothetical protein
MRTLNFCHVCQMHGWPEEPLELVTGSGVKAVLWRMEPSIFGIHANFRWLELEL